MENSEYNEYYTMDYIVIMRKAGFQGNRLEILGVSGPSHLESLIDL